MRQLLLDNKHVVSCC